MDFAPDRAGVLDQLLADAQLSANDIQATLLEFTVSTIANETARTLNHAPGAEVYVCGGGANNKTLMEKLQQQLPDYPVQSTSVLGVSPDWVEATGFAWLARQTINHLPGNMPSVTGAKQQVILGGVYFAH